MSTQAIVLIGFLTIQYVLGMAVNLFVQFPEGVQGSQLWKFAWTQTLLTVHISIGVLLVLGALVFVVRSFRNKDRMWIIFSCTGLIAIVTAGVSGALFMEGQNDAYSYSMSIAFFVAVVAYGWGLYASRKTT